MRMKQYEIEFDPAGWSLGDELEETARAQTPTGEGWMVPVEGEISPQAAGTLNESVFLSESAAESVSDFVPTPAFPSETVPASATQTVFAFEPSFASAFASISAPLPVSSPAFMPAPAHIPAAETVIEDSLSEESIERIVERKISELRIYVLESDITEAQKAVRSVVELSKY